MVKKDKSEETRHALLSFLDSGNKPELSVDVSAANVIPEKPKRAKPKPKEVKPKEVAEAESDSDSDSSSDEEIVITRKKKKKKKSRKESPKKKLREIPDFVLSDEEVDDGLHMMRKQLVSKILF